MPATRYTVGTFPLHAGRHIDFVTSKHQAGPDCAQLPACSASSGTAQRICSPSTWEGVQPVLREHIL